MAFTAAQLLTIGEILRLTPLEIENHFDVFPYDSDTETYVETELTAWATARDVYQSIEPKDRNFGVRYSPGEQKNEIRNRIALALGFDIASLGAGQTRLVRA
jgi:hypothetical protein